MRVQEIASPKAEFAPDSLSAQKGTFGLALIGPQQTNPEHDPHSDSTSLSLANTRKMFAMPRTAAADACIDHLYKGVLFWEGSS